LKDVFDFITSDNPNTKVEYQSGESLNYLPTKNFKVTINPDDVIKNGVVPADQKDKIAPAMEWKYTSNYVTKDNLAMLDILAHNDWKRPVYFAITVGSENLIGLQPYLYKEGFAYHLMPMKTDSASKDQDKTKYKRHGTTEGSNIHEIVSAIEAIDKKYDRESNKQNARHKWDRLWEVLGVVGLWVAAAVGVAGYSARMPFTSVWRDSSSTQLNPANTNERMEVKHEVSSISSGRNQETPPNPWSLREDRRLRRLVDPLVRCAGTPASREGGDKRRGHRPLPQTQDPSARRTQAAGEATACACAIS